MSYSHHNCLGYHRSRSIRLAFEPLECRRVLAAFHLSDYEVDLDVASLPTTAFDNEWSGVAYHRDAISNDEALFVISDVGRIEKYTLDGNGTGGGSLQRIDLLNFGDTEGITWMGANDGCQRLRCHR